MGVRQWKIYGWEFSKEEEKYGSTDIGSSEYKADKEGKHNFLPCSKTEDLWRHNSLKRSYRGNTDNAQ